MDTLTLSAQKQQLSSVWLKAAVVGGLWASIEIIIGSFLHNLRIPMAGSFLASIGVILAIAFFQLWPQKGMIWRAALICALMKSVSPSAILLGPMIGIFTEGLMMELAIFIFGRNLFGYLIAGALCLSSVLLHKIVSILILYGMDVVRIYANMFHFASKQLQISNADPWSLLIALIAIYVIWGMIAALIGYRLGANNGNSEKKKTDIAMLNNAEPSVFEADPNRSYYLALFFFHILFIPAGLYLMNSVDFVKTLPFTGVYVIFNLFYYKRSVRRLKKPVFWIQIIMLILLSTFFWSGFRSEEGLMDLNGLWVGLEMSYRAVFVVVAFSTISIELKNPRIRKFLFRVGFRKLYLAIGLAFSALPEMMAAIPKPSRFFRKPGQAVADIIRHSEQWLNTFELYNEKINPTIEK